MERREREGRENKEAAAILDILFWSCSVECLAKSLVLGLFLPCRELLGSEGLMTHQKGVGPERQ